MLQLLLWCALIAAETKQQTHVFCPRSRAGAPGCQRANPTVAVDIHGAALEASYVQQLCVLLGSHCGVCASMRLQVGLSQARTSKTASFLQNHITIDIFKPNDSPIYWDLNRMKPYRLLNLKTIGQCFRPNDQREMWIFPKYALGQLLAHVRILNSRKIQQTAIQMTNARGNANDTDKLHQQQQQHSTKPAVIATLNPATASCLVYHEPNLINLRVQHHQQRWRWSETSRSRGAACLYELLLEKEPSLISED